MNGPCREAELPAVGPSGLRQAGLVDSQPLIECWKVIPRDRGCENNHNVPCEGNCVVLVKSEVC